MKMRQRKSLWRKRRLTTKQIAMRFMARWRRSRMILTQPLYDDFKPTTIYWDESSEFNAAAWENVHRDMLVNGTGWAVLKATLAETNWVLDLKEQP